MRRLLVVVDYQKDFVNGSLGFEGAELIEDNIINLINEFRSSGDEVVFTLDEHDDTYMTSREGKRLPVLHCIKDQDGWKLTERLQKLVDDSKVFGKPTFGSLDLGNYISDNKDKFDEIVLCGLVSSICVFCNAIIALSSADVNTEIKVVRNATSSYDLDTQEMSFKMLNHLHIQIV